MSAMEGHAAPYVEAQQGQAGELPAAGIAALDRSRAKALEALGERGLPSQRDEDWKYTSIKPITRSRFSPAAPGTDCPEDFVAAAAIENLDAWQLVFADGFYLPPRSKTNGLPEGVRVAGLADALTQNPQPIADRLGSAMGEIPHGFAAMNSAFVGDGALVEIAPGVQLEKPIELLFVSGCSGEGFLSLPRNLVILGEGSQASVIERHLSFSQERSLSNSLTEIILEKAAALDFCCVQDQAERTFHVGGLFARLAQSAKLKATTVTVGRAWVRNDARVNLDAERALVSLDGAYLAFGRSHVDNHTHISHNAPECTSRECYKGVLGDRGHAVFHGRIVVQPGAQQTDSEQSNQNLLLSANAEIDTKPQLEIYADDVKCAHGATVGQLDEAALFYLVSRGVDRETARRMLTQAFAAEVLEGVEPPALQTYLASRVSGQLSSAAAQVSAP
ncbi:MAG TPA: Fe-S cluster assembly protein SufD [Gammaproteobacteria bacterium]|nr:Fe-S cluster assembly protein SufD [Arenicellales bacterium]HCX88114.1 Fe-S cluster assembly protein SufD [Gammaproteobacteria bacterium]|tara:strand:- start:47261 stop:48601 length:1341 start_codon:yes stop_codon:yes gene_type:complete